MKKPLAVLFLMLFCFTSFSQVLQYSSSDILKSKRDKTTKQTIYSKKIPGTANLRFDENRKMAIFYLSSDKTTLTFTDLTIQEKQGIKLAIGMFENRKITIMFAEKDKTVSVIFSDVKFQEGYVLQSISKKSIKGLFEK